MENAMVNETPRRAFYQIKERDRPNRAYEFRQRKQATLDQCAEYVGVKRPTIHKFEVLGRGMDTEHIILLAEFLECDVRDLIAKPAPESE